MTATYIFLTCLRKKYFAQSVCKTYVTDECLTDRALQAVILNIK